MNICYLNHDTNKDTGAGKFALALVGAIKKEKPSWQLDILTHKEGVPTNPLFLGGLESKLKNYDIIHALDGWPYGVIAQKAARKLGKKYIITAVGSGAVKPLYEFIKKGMIKKAYKKSDKLVAVSSNTKKEILKVIPNLKIDVINHGVEAEKFQNNNSNSHLKYKPYILSVGTLKKRKGYEYSVRAFAQIADKYPDLKYLIVGSGPEKELIESLVISNNLEGRVIILDKISEEELASLYHGAELFILLSQNDNYDIEGFGLVFLEAASCGAPVIGTTKSGAEDAVSDGENGFSVPQRDCLGAVEAMEKILSNPELKDKFSRNSLDFAKKMSWARAAEKYIEIYEDIIHN